LQRTRQGVPRELRCRFDNWPWERAGPRIMDHFLNLKIELFIEEGAAVEDSSCLGKEKAGIPQLELIDDFTDLFDQICRGH